MDTAHLTAFVACAEAGSLSWGASRLGLQLSTVSRHIGELERALGASLFVRTGRGVRLTAAGERFLERARHVLRELEAATAEVRSAREFDVTELRLSSPPDLARHLLPQVLVELLAAHPELTVESRTDTRRVSLVEEAYDAVIRLGPLVPSELIARRVGTVSLVVCAAPGVSCANLRELAAIEHVLVEGTRTEIAGRVRGRAVRVRCAGRLRVSSFAEAAEVTARLRAATFLPSFAAAASLASGRLVRVLPQLRLPRVEVHLLSVPRHRGSRVIARLVELVGARLSEAEAIAGMS